MTSAEFEHDDAVFETFQTMSCSIGWCTMALSVLGVISNAVSIYIYTHRVMRSPINVLLAGLSGIDLCLSACFVPSFVVPVWSNCYESPFLLYLMPYCAVYIYPLTMMAQTASVWTFLVIAFDRWIAVCHPLKARWSTTQRSYGALMVVTMAAVCYNFVRFFEYRTVKEYSGNGTVLVRVEHLLKNETLYPAYMPIYYVAMYLITHFIIPFTILISVNILMILSIAKARRQRSMLGRRQKSEHKTTIMMGVVVFVFVMCNTLPFILNFVEAVSPQYFINNETMLIGWALVDVGNLLVVVNTSTTAFIYYACSQRYRRLFRYTLYKMTCDLVCFPFGYCGGMRADISGIDRGYALASTTSSFRCTGTTVVRKGTMDSLCTTAIGYTLPRNGSSNGHSVCGSPRPQLLTARKQINLNIRQNGSDVTLDVRLEDETDFI